MSCVSLSLRPLASLYLGIKDNRDSLLIQWIGPRVFFQMLAAATWIKHNNPPKDLDPAGPHGMAICILLALVFSPGFFTSPSGARKRIYSHRIYDEAVEE